MKKNSRVQAVAKSLQSLCHSSQMKSAQINGQTSQLCLSQLFLFACIVYAKQVMRTKVIIQFGNALIKASTYKEIRNCLHVLNLINQLGTLVY